MKQFSKDCEARRQQISLLESGMLSQSDRKEIEQHLAVCAECKSYQEQLHSMASPLGNWEQHLAGIQPSTAQQMRWAKAIHAASESENHTKSSFSEVLRVAWNELFWSPRRMWMGLAAAWAILLIVNVNPSDKPNTMAKQKSPAFEMILASREQERLVNEFADEKKTKVTEPPKQSAPQPRSELQREWIMI
jgi:anti-sigma factor RsiW